MSEQSGRDGAIRSVAYLLLAVIAAIATPSTDAVSMLLLWLPGIVLFELGFYMYRHWRGQR